MLDSCGMSGTGETPQAQCSFAPRRHRARPADSEHPGAEINQPTVLFSKKKVQMKRGLANKELIWYNLKL
ncbi:hypothetical protein FBF83_18515 [Pseudalkalibacillus hwajinpoensis]|uniref:Uncharacterized protein n=1 Tax=Guptibacillus hwajinpoensis TaxID=208199 RepID=A0A4U1MBL0_9BACL|nr:hypothetical protein FBF83_18515 [Pseudalkalibacillus hwajinpoensis]